MGNQRYVNLDGSFEIYWALKYLDEGRSQDWNAYWHASVLVNGGCCIHPVLSLAENIGFDGSGTQCTPDSAHMHRPTINSLSVRKIPLVERPEFRRAMTQTSFKNRAEIRLKDWARQLYFGVLGMKDHPRDLLRRVRVAK
jgi:hypothetical protein